MLVLTRDVDQVIEIGDDIKITVVALGRRQVKLGIDAPKGLAVHRQEVAERIRREGKRIARALEEELSDG